ncbi:MAG: BCD family MFS transporter [Burkholderiaceae bacterium]|jgi:BCD family chlorophyll transporter-like MFS transporter
MKPFGWFQICRLGLVQAAIGGVVVLATSTLNRVIVVELGLAAVIPGLMVAGHYLLQIIRPRMGFGADQSGRCVPWIRGGMLSLAAGGLTAGYGTGLMVTALYPGLSICALGFLLIGIGVSACGTSVLTLLAKSVQAPRRAGAATAVWLMMIAGFAVTAGTAGHFLDPFTMDRLLLVSAWVTGLALLLTTLATWRLETVEAPTPKATSPIHAEAVGSLQPEDRSSFREALKSVLEQPAVRRFTVFVFVSMLAFSAQDLILEPYAGLVFGYSPGQSTQLSGLQHGGVLTGMLLVPLSQLIPIIGQRAGLLRFWTITGCLLSGVALAGLTLGGLSPTDWPLRANVFGLGMANGAFSIAAIASMMALAGQGEGRREGTRMGVWGAAQAVAFAAGGLLGTTMADLAGQVISELSTAYGTVFLLEALGFVWAAYLGSQLNQNEPSISPLASKSNEHHSEETCRA